MKIWGGEGDNSEPKVLRCQGAQRQNPEQAAT